jgi:hypothetical protein
MKPTLKAPGIKRLKLEHEKLHSKFAFIFNLRGYDQGRLLIRIAGPLVGMCKLNPMLNECAWFRRWKLKCG